LDSPIDIGVGKNQLLFLVVSNIHVGNYMSRYAAWIKDVESGVQES
jgi:hypothetical protein